MNSSRLFLDQSASHGSMLFLGSNNALCQVPRSVISMDENPARKRLFFASPEESIYNEEYSDEQLPEKKRRLTPEQVNLLEKSFEEENKLEPERKTELAKKLGLQPRQVAVWFQNRRARSKTKQLERDFDLLKAAYEGLLLNYQSLLKENDKLKSEVHSLTEKLHAKESNGLEGPTSGLMQEPPLDEPSKLTQQQHNKAEDGASSGSSGVENPYHHLVVDSTGDSYFDCLPPPPPPCLVAVHSEEDDISDDGRSSYFPFMFDVVATNHQVEEAEEEEGGQDLGWWVWS
ncbi:hypothetical protein Cgig2_012616 [Carnegiea gigantea]|uniref:Homeobox-leucine zipper protein n=1 Tax=Carnegiea gigantea TaxID=171969 RepID=A0A9Q1K0M9_9CARY|nr:hypothetical protein Cgig2_012616 [Carnegiea gigantea]